MRRDIASAPCSGLDLRWDSPEKGHTRISVLPPRPSDALVLVIDLKVDVTQTLWYADAQIDAGIATADDPDLHRPLVLHGLIFDCELLSGTHHAHCLWEVVCAWGNWSTGKREV